MPVFTTIEGRWKGGPNDNLISIEKGKDGVTRGDLKGKNGGRAGFEGKLLNKGKALKGYWFDADASVTEAHRYNCTIDVTIDEAADPTGNTLVGKYKTKDGGSGEWTAKRFNESADVKREDRKIASFAYKTKQIFERLTENNHSKRNTMLETQRGEILSSTEGHAWFDGAIMYIPPPSVGAEYLDSTDLARTLKRMEEDKIAAYKARLEADCTTMKALMEAGKGDILKKRYNVDMDGAKRFVDIYERLLKGEAAFEALRERPNFKPGLGPWHADSEKPAEHIADPYLTEFELMSKLKKAEPGHWEAFRVRLEGEVAWLTANASNGDALKKKGLDEDMAKRKIEIYSKLVKGELNLAKLAERPEFKPNNPSVQLASSKPAEHMPDKYFSSVELERDLAKRDKAHWAAYKEKLESEVAWLTSKLEDSEALKKRGIDQDGAKRRIEIYSKIIKSEAQSGKLAERPAMKPNPPGQTYRMSGTVMLHPRNVRSMLKSMH